MTYAMDRDRGGSHVDAGFDSGSQIPEAQERLPLRSKNQSRTPLPLPQLSILCLTRIAETTAYTQVLDFSRAVYLTWILNNRALVSNEDIPICQSGE